MHLIHPNVQVAPETAECNLVSIELPLVPRWKLKFTGCLPCVIALKARHHHSHHLALSQAANCLPPVRVMVRICTYYGPKSPQTHPCRSTSALRGCSLGCRYRDLTLEVSVDGGLYPSFLPFRLIRRVPEQRPSALFSGLRRQARQSNSYARPVWVVQHIEDRDRTFGALLVGSSGCR